jgi:hypothetical protein
MLYFKMLSQNLSTWIEENHENRLRFVSLQVEIRARGLTNMKQEC